MLKYIAKRLLQLIPTLIIVSILIFSIVRFIPGDPITLLYGITEGAGTDQAYIEYMKDQYGLNDPYHVQYARWIGDFAKGDLGTSIYTHKPIAVELANRYKSTLILAIGGTLVGALIGIAFGIIAATNHNRWIDRLVMSMSVISVSTPSFFLAILLMLFFSIYLGWLPSMGLDSVSHAILPVLTLGLHAIGMIARTTRSSMLDVMEQDYIRTAKSKGVTHKVIVLKHSLKNALIPILTAVGLRFGSLLVGSAVVERVFSIKGLGRFMVDGISNRDYPVIQSTVLVFAISFVLVNTLVDILYAAVDPRVKLD